MTLFRLGALSALLVGCASAPEAVLGAKAPAPIAQKGPVESYELSPQTLKVEADIKAGSGYTLRFAKVRGRLDLSPTVQEASSLDVEIDTTSAEASWQLVADIARDQFLHVQAHPSARFASRALRKDAEGGFTLYGGLLLHGISQTLSTPVTIAVEPCRATLDVEFSVDRRAFGVVADGAIDSFVGDSVVLRISVDVPRNTDEPACRVADGNGTGNGSDNINGTDVNGSDVNGTNTTQDLHYRRGDCH